MVYIENHPLLWKFPMENYTPLDISMENYSVLLWNFQGAATPPPVQTKNAMCAIIKRGNINFHVGLIYFTGLDCLVALAKHRKNYDLATFTDRIKVCILIHRSTIDLQV